MTVKEFNENYPVGAFVKYQDEKGKEVTSEVRFPAETIETGDPVHPKRDVFYVKGNPDAVSLSNLLDLYQIPHENGNPVTQDK